MLSGWHVVTYFRQKFLASWEASKFGVKKQSRFPKFGAQYYIMLRSVDDGGGGDTGSGIASSSYSKSNENTIIIIKRQAYWLSNYYWLY